MKLLLILIIILSFSLASAEEKKNHLFFGMDVNGFLNSLDPSSGNVVIYKNGQGMIKIVNFIYPLYATGNIKVKDKDMRMSFKLYAFF
jgi:hypothetical protein